MKTTSNCGLSMMRHELHRALGVTQKTAWFMGHRVRLALHAGSFDKLTGDVEADETFIGGKARNMHIAQRKRRITGTGGKDKTAVMGILERGGKVRTVVVENRKKKALQAEVHKHGGYGASRIGMKHPEVFGALYIMSPCCMSPMAGGGPGPADQMKERAIASEKKVADAKSPADLAAQSPGFASAQYASAAAWAPDPKNPPLYFDLPTKDGVPQPEIVAKFTANSPLSFVDQYIGNLKQYRAIAMDVADQDGLRFDATKLHTVLDNYGIANSFEIYSGTHTSAVADRFQNHVLPFFSKNLCFTADCR
jgi:hypothetical protein